MRILLCRGSELQIHLRYHKRLFQEGSVMELVDSDEDEFDAHLEALKDIRILFPKNIKILIK